MDNDYAMIRKAQQPHAPDLAALVGMRAPKASPRSGLRRGLARDASAGEAGCWARGKTMNNAKLLRSAFGLMCVIWIIMGCNRESVKQGTEAEMTRTTHVRVVSSIDDKVTFEVDGYVISCDTPRLYKPNGSAWLKVDQSLPQKGVYYLDDQWRGYGWCDIVQCVPAENPYSVPLVTYERIGERPPPASWVNAVPGLVPAFRSVPIHGKLRITMDLYSDKNCKQAHPIEIFVDN